jgi:hypothetical protein
MIDRVLAAASAVPFVVGALAGPAGAPARSELTFADPAIVEASGLVVRDGLYVTVNDSGDQGRVFVVDGSGRTVGATSWAEEPIDVEALAPAGPGQVWVADVGDNRAARGSVRLLRVPYGRGDRTVTPTAYQLVYPDGPRDAETLLAQPRTGRLFVVSKSIFGGTVYAVPRQLSPDRPNRLRAVAAAPGLATDGAFFPDGRHLVVRGYADATVYRYPSFAEVGTLPLPRQEQGEGIAVDERGDVHVCTEGQHTDVLAVRLPARLQRALEPPASSASTGHGSSPRPAAEPEDRPGSAHWWTWLAGGAAALGFAGAASRLLHRRGAAAEDLT